MKIEIKYLNHSEIDLKRWDGCVKGSVNQLVYAHSWYLDVVWENWSALVMGDYEYVMPLFPAKKWGINYIHQPKFVLQSGIFSANILNKVIVSRFLSSIPSKFKYAEINLNIFNRTGMLAGFEFFPATTYQLDLIKTYDHLVGDFSILTMQGLNKAKSEGVFVNEELDTVGFLNFMSQTDLAKNIRFKKGDYQTVQRLVGRAMSNGAGKVYSAYSSSNELIAAAFFVGSGTKPIMLLTAESKKENSHIALYAIVNHFITLFNGSNITLDLTGMQLNSSLNLCEGFGASAAQYTVVRKKSLPIFIRKHFLF